MLRSLANPTDAKRRVKRVSPFWPRSFRAGRQNQIDASGFIGDISAFIDLMRDLVVRFDRAPRCFHGVDDGPLRPRRADIRSLPLIPLQHMPSKYTTSLGLCAGETFADNTRIVSPSTPVQHSGNGPRRTRHRSGKKVRRPLGHCMMPAGGCASGSFARLQPPLPGLRLAGGMTVRTLLDGRAQTGSGLILDLRVTNRV